MIKYRVFIARWLRKNIWWLIIRRVVAQLGNTGGSISEYYSRLSVVKQSVRNCGCHKLVIRCASPPTH